MNPITLEAEKREVLTKGSTHKIRASGRVPGVTYGDNAKPVNLSVDAKALNAAIHSELGRNALINLKIGGDSHAVLVKEIQRHLITRAIRHVDFYRVSLKKKIEVRVPVHVKGEAPGVKLGGGVLEHLIREIQVRCLPAEIPAFVDVDVSGLQLHQAIRGKDLILPKGAELLNDPEGVIIHVLTVHVVEETPAPGAVAAGATSAEPEVIKKGKVEEGAEGAPAGKAGGTAAASASGKASAGQPAKADAKKPEGK